MPMIVVTVWDDLVAVLSVLGVRLRPTTPPQTSMYHPSTAAPRTARQTILSVMREEERQRLLR